MKTCEFNAGGKLCGKRAAYGTSYSDRCQYLCGGCQSIVYADTWRLPLDAEVLATLLDEELERDNWGDVDPYTFKLVAAGEGGPDAALREVLERVAERWNKGDL